MNRRAETGGRRASGRSQRRESTLSGDLRLASYPPPYPDGWYRLAGSKSLRRGHTRYLECLGRAVVLWRSADADDVFAMEAHCPHLGGNLANGRVCGDRIECPFHAWQFTGDGRVASVPYSSALPSRLAAESFPVEEVHGQIFMYHRSSGRQRATDEVPYPVPRVPEIDDGSFAFRGHYAAGRIRTHVIELIENAADYAHFGYVHSRMNVPYTQIPVPGMHLDHSALLDLDDDRDEHRLPVYVETVLKVSGRHIERTRTNSKITFTGAGSIVNFRITLPDVGEIEIIQTQLPVAPLDQRVDFRWFADPEVPRAAVWYTVGNWVSQWRKDVRLWEAKIFRQSPTLCRDDGPVMRLRRRYSRYFPDWTPAAERSPSWAAEERTTTGGGACRAP
ncbi:MAG: Rieske 2Fe-2S domain-containing protein [Acidimicrobiaceae bacterium]|nr:Rieske 2Fe-2S domain-containing protein [Acidimicrobiaceae bacterium]MDE0318838.1 Rieske 2Fe-2S domain-containing protein [Acidimicrobiaceae bacterium]